MVNCTLTWNWSDCGSAFYIVPGTDVSLTNCILWMNMPGWQFDGSDPNSVSYSDIEGGFLGQGNIDADPLFVDPDGPDGDWFSWEDNDYRLSPDSPCIDAADNRAVPPDTADLDGDGDVDEHTPVDLDGNPRFVDDLLTDDTGVPHVPEYLEIVDMGAYEFQFCLGDLDADREIGLGDLATLLAHYETTDATYEDGDLDGDGDVDLADLALLLAVYETDCP